MQKYISQQLLKLSKDAVLAKLPLSAQMNMQKLITNS